MFSKSNFPIVTYLEPKKYGSSNKGISFSKMPVRDIKIGNFNNTPSIGYYKPNLNVIRGKNCRDIKFSDRGNKKYLLHKIWGSYDVGTEYRSVKLD
jgi:hypothetical protein